MPPHEKGKKKGIGRNLKNWVYVLYGGDSIKRGSLDFPPSYGSVDTYMSLNFSSFELPMYYFLQIKNYRSLNRNTHLFRSFLCCINADRLCTLDRVERPLMEIP